VLLHRDIEIFDQARGLEVGVVRAYRLGFFGVLAAFLSGSFEA
jgi:hypothetical protein